MSEREGPEWFFDERFATLQAVQEVLARRGYLLYPVEKEHCEGLVTGPSLHRIHTQVKKRGFGNVAGRVAVTFSGFARDDREVFAIPEIRAYWQKLDRELPVLPAPNFNWPGCRCCFWGRLRRSLTGPRSEDTASKSPTAPEFLRMHSLGFTRWGARIT